MEVGTCPSSVRGAEVEIVCAVDNCVYVFTRVVDKATAS